MSSQKRQYWRDRLRHVVPGLFHSDAPAASRDARFALYYKKDLVGTLALKKGHWIFSYSDAFRTLSPTKCRTITEFPDLTKTYESDELWPFFLMRIPSLKQDSVQKVVEAEKIDATDEVELLKRFGQRTVANPFELIAS